MTQTKPIHGSDGLTVWLLMDKWFYDLMGLVSWINIGLDQNGYYGLSNPIQFFHIIFYSLSRSHETFIIDQDTIQPFWVIDFGLSITAQQLIFLVSQTLFFFSFTLWVIVWCTFVLGSILKWIFLGLKVTLMEGLCHFLLYLCFSWVMIEAIHV